MTLFFTIKKSISADTASKNQIFPTTGYHFAKKSAMSG
jgi:hypothetical protein